MKSKKINWLFTFLYLNLALVLVFSLWFMLVQIGTEFFYSLYYSVNFSFLNINFIKAIKTGVFCGVLSGSGCWWIYYQRYRESKKR